MAAARGGRRAARYAAAGQRLQRGVVPPGEDGAPGRRAARQQVDPGHRVAVAVVGGGERGQQRVEVGQPFGVHGHQRRLHRKQLERRAQHDPCQAHAARGRVEQVCAGGEDPHLAVGRQQLHGAHVPGEGAGDVVVLAVDVRADRPAHRHIAGPGGDRHEPAQRQQHLHQPVQADPRLAGHRSGAGVDLAHPVQARGVQDGAARVLRRVAVRPAQAARDAAARPAPAHDRHGLLHGAGVRDRRAGGGCPAPAGEEPCGAEGRRGLRGQRRLNGHGGDRIAPECEYLEAAPRMSLKE